MDLLTRLSAVVCVALFAATLTTAKTTETDSKPTTHAASKNPTPGSHTSASHKKSSKSTSTSAHSKTSKNKRSRKSAANRHAHGQQKIDPQRTTEIQQALIREHYLEGKPTGVWNDATQQAMQRYQADNNWQSKTTPDARALIKLGLGPDHEHLLNPDSAMTSQSQAPNSISTPAVTPSTATAKPQR
ncbi:MAG: peptidoglycan-binding protein [Terriglobales bacterium]